MDNEIVQQLAFFALNFALILSTLLFYAIFGWVIANWLIMFGILSPMNRWLNGRSQDLGGYLQSLHQIQIISRQIVAFFDDFDDFDGLIKIDSSMPSAIFKIVCKVNFVNTANLDGISLAKTWHKKLQLFITTQSSMDTIKMETIYSYFFYR